MWRKCICRLSAVVCPSPCPYSCPVCPASCPSTWTNVLHSAPSPISFGRGAGPFHTYLHWRNLMSSQKPGPKYLSWIEACVCVGGEKEKDVCVPGVLLDTCSIYPCPGSCYSVLVLFTPSHLPLIMRASFVHFSVPAVPVLWLRSGPWDSFFRTTFKQGLRIR